jgi:hypothetical protein
MCTITETAPESSANPCYRYRDVLKPRSTPTFPLTVKCLMGPAQKLERLFGISNARLQIHYPRSTNLAAGTMEETGLSLKSPLTRLSRSRMSFHPRPSMLEDLPVARPCLVGGAPGHHIGPPHRHTTKYDVGSAKRKIIIIGQILCI